MPRCPACHRRLRPSSPCPEDGWLRQATEPPLATSGDEHATPPALAGFTSGRLLGAGGFSLVWEVAREKAATPALALKVGRGDSPVFHERFRRDAEAMERIGPPYAPRLHELGRLSDGRPYIVMERIEAPTLAHLLAAHASPPGARWAAMAARAVVLALEAAHARDVVHRDLKPENIFLVETEARAALIDFGLMRRVGGGSEERAITREGTIVGTPEYMAPEQIRGEPLQGARADIYAFGVILFEMLTLRPPFAGERGEVEHGHLELRPPRPGEVVQAPRAMDDLVLACLAKEPSRRPGSAAEVRRAIERIAADLVGGAALSTAPPPASAPISSPISAPRSSPILAEGRQPMVVLVAETSAPAVQVIAAVTGRKGTVARQSGSRFVCVFSGADTDDPVHTAIATARDLEQRHRARAALHLATLSVRRKSRGPPAVYGLAIDRPETWLPDASATGILVTPELARTLPPSDLAPTAAGAPHFALKPAVTQLSGVVGPSEVGLFGRDDVLASLAASASQSFASRSPGLFTLIGDHGLGKSRIAGEAVALAARVAPSARVIALRSEQPLAGGHGQTTRELLSRVLDLDDDPTPPGLEVVQRHCVKRLGAEVGGEVWPSVAAALGRTAPHASPATPRSIHHGAMRALAEGLHALAKQAPLAIIVDDAHWADDTALDALEYATLGASDCPLWVMVTAHPRFDEARRGFGLRARRHNRAALAPLDEAAGMRLATELLLPAEYPPAAALARLVAWAGGNPFCLAELIRTLKRSGIVRRSPHTGSFYVATTELDRLPPSPAWQWLAVKKLDALRPELAACVRLCSVLGQEFSREEVERVQDALARAREAGTRVDVGVGLEALVASGILARRAGDRYSFQSPTFRDAVSELLDPVHREAIHRVAFGVYRAEREPSPHVLERLARHAGAAGMREEAASAFLTLASLARSRHRHVDADQHYTAALASLDPADVKRRAHALAGRGKARYLLHRIRDALDDLRAAREFAEQAGDAAMTADLLLEEATALDWAHSFDESARRAEQARALVGALRDGRLQSRLFVTLGRSLFRQQRVAEAIDLLRRGAEGAEADADHDTRAVALLMLSSALVLLGRLTEAEEKFHEVIALCAEVDDRLHLGSAYANRSLLWTARAAPDRALEDLRRAIQIAREVGNPWMERNATHNVAELLYWGGQDDEALALAQRSRLLEERFVERVVPDDSLLLARISTSRGDYAEATRLLAWIKERCPADTLAPTERVFVRALSLVLADASPPGEAAVWDALVEEAVQGFPAEELLEVLYLRARAALRNGRRDQVVECIHRSNDRLASCPIWVPRFSSLIRLFEAR